MYTVFERIPLKAEFATPDGARRAGQAYDIAAGGNAHDSEGHSGHAFFFFEAGAGALVVDNGNIRIHITSRNRHTFGRFHHEALHWQDQVAWPQPRRQLTNHFSAEGEVQRRPE